jgi:hypothetical protein
MDYKEALEFAIDRTRERIKQLGDDARAVVGDDEDFSDTTTREEWAALRSAQGGMMECLDMMTQVQAMAKSFDPDPAQAWADQNAKMAVDSGWLESL